MKGENTKLQYIVGKRNGKVYRIYLKDLKMIRPVGKKITPKVPEFDIGSTD